MILLDTSVLIEMFRAKDRNIKVIPFDLISSNAAIEIYKLLKKQNQMIDLADLFIAATALSHNLTLATLNLKHFHRIQNLRILK